MFNTTSILGKILNEKKIKYPIIFIWYFIGVSLTYFLSFLIRFDGEFDIENMVVYFETIPILLILAFIVFKVCNLYSGLWRYANIKDIPRTIIAVL